MQENSKPRSKHAFCLQNQEKELRQKFSEEEKQLADKEREIERAKMELEKNQLEREKEVMQKVVTLFIKLKRFDVISTADCIFHFSKTTFRRPKW